MSFLQGTMITSLKIFALFIVGLSPAANAIDFHYRFYDNDGCDHASAPQDTFPPNELGPSLGSQDQCISAPQSGNWTTLELDNSLDTGGLALITFCNSNCEGAKSSEQQNSRCFVAPPSCFLGSFSVTHTTSGGGDAFSSQPSSSSTAKSLSNPSTQSSNTSNSNPSTVTVGQISFGAGSSSSTPNRSSDTSKPKISTGTVIGGIVGGVVVIAGLVFIFVFLLRRARKRQRVLSFGISEFPTPFKPSAAATAIDKGHPMSLTPIPVQTTAKSVRTDYSPKAPVVPSTYALFIVSLSPAVDAINFLYRFYDNNVCDHNSPPQDTFPLNGLGPLLGSDDQCLSAPQSGNWTTLELNDSLNTGGWTLKTFCNDDCEGAESYEQSNARCFIAAPGCFIGSFSVTQATSSIESNSSSHSSSSSTTQLSTSLSTQSSRSTSSTPSQSSDTSKSKISTGSVIGSVIGSVAIIAGLIFIPFLLLRRARKRQSVLPFSIAGLARPMGSVEPFGSSPAATNMDERHRVSHIPIPVQTTGKFDRADHSPRVPVVVSSPRQHRLPLHNRPDPFQIQRQEDSGIRFSETEGSSVQPPLYTRN
ncbi:hypothetical protein GALMADRAFT_138712 [Galerina marginata CBS 339.88]|uniref:P/Homo B domain-containing protein n=1 Tax=Galerina marginata (strain CBS 339.88) TaxID=685588 RepID=A0A067T370_GALM3|nr:hypothetical protein GALMADRAFT_138712 [Galerina marginata CBS 339.88]